MDEEKVEKYNHKEALVLIFFRNIMEFVFKVE